MRNKKIISYLIEALYLLTIFLYLLVMKVVYSNTSSYDFMMFLFIACLIIGILMAIGPKYNRYVGIVLAIPYTLYLVAQQIYHRAFGQFFRFQTALGLSKEVAGVSDSVIELIGFSDLVPFVVLIIITVIFIVLYFMFEKEIKYTMRVRLVSILFIVGGAMSLFINNANIKASTEGWTNFDIYKSDYYVYDTIPNTNQFVDKFGLLSLLYRDGQITISHESSDTSNAKQEIDDFFLEKKINHENNEMTGIFAGKSVLFVQAESFMNAAISEEFTPNIYYYMNSGIHVKDFNTPLLIGSTSDTEFMSNTSMIPMTSGYPVCYKYVNNTYPLTLGNIFKDRGYNTMAFHNNYAEYYNRDIAFTKYGYDFYDSYKLGLINLEPDTKLAEQIGWILAEKESFLGYWITFSGHQPYDLSSTGVDEGDVQLIKSKYPELNDEYVSYIAKAMDVDKAIFNFLNVMDWSGKLDDVVIVFYGDHTAKALDFSKGSNWDNVFHTNIEDNPEIAHTPLIIYGNGIEKKEISKASTTLDILPTIVNLWGFDTELKYALGNDIFDPNYNGFYFDESGNYKTNDFSYNIINDELILNSGYLESEALLEISYFNKIKDISSKILKMDYFNE